MRSQNFDLIAPFYDKLTTLVFGQSIYDSAEIFLPELKSCTKILVLGGGTGKFLPSLLRLSSADIWFVDASAEMIRRAKLQAADARIHFIVGTENAIPPDKRFDAVLTFYYLDLFAPADLPAVLAQIKPSLAENAYWLAADFTNNGKWWQRLLLVVMYFFFRMTAGLKTRTLPDWKLYLRNAGFEILYSVSRRRGFIESVLLRATCCANPPKPQSMPSRYPQTFILEAKE